VHDFPDKTLGKAIPYGIYDIGADNGFVNVGIIKETAAFAVASIRSWWQQLGQARYPAARTLQITADCGGLNSSRTRLWKVELQRLANDTGLEISVCHFPPGHLEVEQVGMGGRPAGRDEMLSAVRRARSPSR